MDSVRGFLQRLLQGRYVVLLEGEVARERAENARLRAENRALMNSLLGTAGFPPVPDVAGEAPKPPACGAPRLRKRSWHQIQAWRENEAARDATMNFEGVDRYAVTNRTGAEARPNGPVSHS